MKRIDPPGPKGLPLLGVALQLRRDPLRLLRSVVEEYGDFVQLPLLGISLTPMEPRRRLYLLNHPASVRHVCVSSKDKYRPHEQLVRKLRRTLRLREGELLTSAGAAWSERKASLQPAFTEKGLARVADKVSRSLGALAARWSELPDGGSIDVDVEMTRFVTHLFASLFVGLELDGADAPLAAAWERTLNGLSRRMAAPLPALLELRRREACEFDDALKNVEQRLRELIRARRERTSCPGDLLATWMQGAAARGGAALGDRDHRDQMMLLLLAGRKNVSNALSWSCHLLGTHPAVAERLAEEAEAKLGDGAPTPDDLDAMPYVRMVQRETLRLYPTAWLIARSCLEDDVVGGYWIPRGATVFMSPYSIHRHPSFWADPESFQPERFAADRHLTPEAYLPFGKGPRTCIGSFLTELIMQAALVTLARRFVFAPRPGHTVRIKATSSLHPEGGLPMVLRRRSARRVHAV